MLNRFSSKYFVDENGCHVWAGNKSKSGYGKFKLKDGTQARAHRVAWEMTNGKIPDGVFVLHKCDVRACVNPDHLFLGTHADNMRDMVRKGRGLSGEMNGRAKLTAEDVLSIRQSHGTDAEKARGLGVSEATVRQARVGRKWQHLSIHRVNETKDDAEAA